MSLRRRLALLLCPELTPETCDVTPVFRSVRTDASEAQALRRSRDYKAGFWAGVDLARRLFNKWNACLPTRRERLEEEGDRRGISRPEIGRIWARLRDGERLDHLFPEIDWNFVFFGERNPNQEDPA
ncbi:hypothetical protein [Roseovarius sp. MBR-6]|jgi:hypothetical protein|uniref:hypothetical protein n=1 Tax=Roseovarius sp. MBR-6 TaxID=3156459 RepID=UPI0033925959